MADLVGIDRAVAASSGLWRFRRRDRERVGSSEFVDAAPIAALRYSHLIDHQGR